MGGSLWRQFEGSVAIASGHTGNFLWGDNSFDDKIERNRAQIRQQPTRYLRDPSRYDVTAANLLNLRYKKVDDNGNPLRRPGVSSPFRVPTGRMGIEELREKLEEQQQIVIPEGIG